MSLLFILQTEFAKYGMVSLTISKGRKPHTSSTYSIVKGGSFTVLLTNGKQIVGY